MLPKSMVKLNWLLLWQKVKVTRFDVVVSGVVALVAAVFIALVALADAGEAATVKATLLSRLNGAVQSVLTWLDGFETTNAVVTFMFWGFVGLVAYGSVMVVAKISQEVRYESELSTDDYVHPARKTNRDIIVAELASTLVKAAVGIFLLVALAVLVFVVLPALIVQVRSAVLQPGLMAWLSALAATVLMAADTCLVTLVTRTLIHHQLLLDE